MNRVTHDKKNDTIPAAPPEEVRDNSTWSDVASGAFGLRDQLQTLAKATGGPLGKSLKGLAGQLQDLGETIIMRAQSERKTRAATVGEKVAAIDALGYIRDAVDVASDAATSESLGSTLYRQVIELDHLSDTFRELLGLEKAVTS